MTALKLVQNSNVLDISGGEGGIAHVAQELRNIKANLARRHGELVARDMVAEAFAQVFAGWSSEKDQALPNRFALEVALDNAFKVAQAQRWPFGGAA